MFQESHEVVHKDQDPKKVRREVVGQAGEYCSQAAPVELGRGHPIGPTILTQNLSLIVAIMYFQSLRCTLILRCAFADIRLEQDERSPSQVEPGREQVVQGRLLCGLPLGGPSAPEATRGVPGPFPQGQGRRMRRPVQVVEKEGTTTNDTSVSSNLAPLANLLANRGSPHRIRGRSYDFVGGRSELRLRSDR